MMHASQIASTMSGFTAEFFGGLQSFSDNSLNNSKIDMSYQNPNKSQIIRQIRLDSIYKINQIHIKALNYLVFDKIYLASLRTYRAQQKTQMNISKCFYKLDLLQKIKNDKYKSWSFRKLIKFTEQFDMRNMGNQIKKQQTFYKQSKIIQEKKQPNNQNYNKNKKLEQIYQKQNSQKQLEKSNNNFLESDVKKFIQTIQKLFGNKKKLQQGMNSIKQRQVYLTKKIYFIDLLVHTVNKNLRFGFVNIINSQTIVHENLIKSNTSIRVNESNNIKPASKNKIQNRIIQSTIFPNQSSNIFCQSYGLQSNVKFKKNLKQSKCFNIQNQIVRIGRPISGLKFNKCYKKKDAFSPQKKQDKQDNQQKQMISSRSSKLIQKKPFLTLNPAKSQKIIDLSKVVKIQTDLNDKGFQQKRAFKDFTYLKKSYHLTNQQFKLELPDIHDQIIRQENILNESRSLSLEDKINFNKKIQKVDNKKPLQFSHKKYKSKKSLLQKSKKSTLKSQQQQIEPVNVQSLKSYYFPDQLPNNGKIISGITGQRHYSTKYIGSPKWSGNQKQRIVTQSNMKSADKINPYLQQLKQKISRRPSQKVISINKCIQRNGGRSNSKNSRNGKQDRKKFQSQQIQNTNHQLALKSRNISPQTKVKVEPTRTPPAETPKQWYFYTNNPSKIASPARPSQNIKSNNLQFHKITKAPNN